MTLQHAEKHPALDLPHAQQAILTRREQIRISMELKSSDGAYENTFENLKRSVRTLVLNEGADLRLLLKVIHPAIYKRHKFPLK